ncbi:MAG: hypothetical protein J6T34_04215 [Bacilli bacterium]|nr:hypothetical protein [Bacilli bacterium]
MINYDKTEIREQLNIESIFELLQEWGGDPEYTNFGILSSTICHNQPGEGSHKLYYYSNSDLFTCYTGCQGSFDVFELTCKVAKIQWNEDFDLNDAVRWVARRFGISGRLEDDSKEDQIEDWKFLATYGRIKEIELADKKNIVLKEYDDSILDRFNYNIKIEPWLREGVSADALAEARIGYYLGTDQITIPHFDVNNRFIGLRGRTVVKEEAELFGKYRPMRVNKQLYNHPLGMNLYNLNHSKKAIKVLEKAIVFEGEKSCLLYKTYFGSENDISVACCGSNLSAYQVQLLQEAGAKEIIIAFDRQFKEIGDTEFKHLTKNLMKIKGKYGNQVNISFIFDKNMITGYKDSPIDCGKDIFLKLFKERIVL